MAQQPQDEIEDVSDDVLGKLLASVTNNASKMKDDDFKKVTGVNKSDPAKANEGTKSTPTQINDLSSLPVEMKLQILSFLDPTVQKQAAPLVTDETQLLAPVQFLKFFKEPSTPAFFSKEDFSLLETEGYIIKDNFLGSLAAAQQIYNEAEDLYSSGKLQKSSMSRGEGSWVNTKVRGDIVMWLNNKSVIQDSHLNIYNLIEKIDALRMELNHNCEFNSQQTQIHLACYPGEGARYVRHLDAYQGGSQRRITMLYYFNVAWKPGDGGELRLFCNEKVSRALRTDLDQLIKTAKVISNKFNIHDAGYVDVEPIADRLLVFQSRSIEHEGD